MQVMTSKIKRNGIKLLANFLMENHTNPLHALRNIQDWIDRAESQIDQGKDFVNIELSWHYSTDGISKKLVLSKVWFEVQIVEAKEFI